MAVLVGALWGKASATLRALLRSGSEFEPLPPQPAKSNLPSPCIEAWRAGMAVLVGALWGKASATLRLLRSGPELEPFPPRPVKYEVDHVESALQPH
jgi:hypothetical protein